MLHQAATVVLGPLLLAQGLLARRRTPRLPEPPGARRGVSGAGRRLRLLIVGDSAAAGVGAGHQDEALLGRTVAGLAERFRVEWTLLARTGATTESTLRRLRTWDGGPFDLAVTSLGVNDLTAGVAAAGWRRRQAELRELLRSRFGVARIVVSGFPPVAGFPALPQPLRWYLGRRARQLDRLLERDVAAEPGCRFLGLRFPLDPGLMASDGFHPGPRVYREWGRQVAELAAAAFAATDLRPAP